MTRSPTPEHGWPWTVQPSPYGTCALRGDISEEDQHHAAKAHWKPRNNPWWHLLRWPVNHRVVPIRSSSYNAPAGQQRGSHTPREQAEPVRCPMAPASHPLHGTLRRRVSPLDNRPISSVAQRIGSPRARRCLCERRVGLHSVVEAEPWTRVRRLGNGSLGASREDLETRRTLRCRQRVAAEREPRTEVRTGAPRPW